MSSCFLKIWPTLKITEKNNNWWVRNEQFYFPQTHSSLTKLSGQVLSNSTSKVVHFRCHVNPVTDLCCHKMVTKSLLCCLVDSGIVLGTSVLVKLEQLRPPEGFAHLLELMVVVTLAQKAGSGPAGVVRRSGDKTSHSQFTDFNVPSTSPDWVWLELSGDLEIKQVTVSAQILMFHQHHWIWSGWSCQIWR